MGDLGLEGACTGVGWRLIGATGGGADVVGGAAGLGHWCGRGLQPASRMAGRIQSMMTVGSLSATNAWTVEQTVLRQREHRCQLCVGSQAAAAAAAAAVARRRALAASASALPGLTSANVSSGTGAFSPSARVSTVRLLEVLGASRLTGRARGAVRDLTRDAWQVVAPATGTEARATHIAGMLERVSRRGRSGRENS